MRTEAAFSNSSKTCRKLRRLGAVLGLSLGSVFLASCSAPPAAVMAAPVGNQDLPKGWQAPNLTVPDQYGRPVNVQKATSGPWAVAFFYPKADTPG